MNVYCKQIHANKFEKIYKTYKLVENTNLNFMLELT